MRNFTRFFALSISICLSLMLAAQEDRGIVVVRKIVQEDGKTITVKKRITDRSDLEAYLRDIKAAEEQKIELHTITEEGENIEIDRTDGETILFFRRAAKDQEDGEGLEQEIERLQIILHDEEEALRATGRREVRSDRPLLGVYLNDHFEGGGVQVTGIVPESGAYHAGLRGGDVLTAVDGRPVDGTPALRDILSGHQPGDVLEVSILRNDQPSRLPVTLTDRRETHQRNDTEERDPCRVFIGVYTHSGSGLPGQGVRVTGIIEDTPAEVAGLQAGDYITAIDGVPVSSYGEVLRERNRHEPGDWFTLSYRRGDSPVTVEAQFRSCEEAAAIDEEKLSESLAAPDTATGENLEETPLFDGDRQLQLTYHRAFPNPTFGKLTLQFQGEAVPTNVLISGPDGKVIYQETINNFDGFYDKQLNIGQETPGAYFLSIRQGERLLTKKIVLMPRV